MPVDWILLAAGGAGYLSFVDGGYVRVAVDDLAGAIEVVDRASSRGQVLPLEPWQRVNRALYLAGEIPTSALDGYVRKERAPTMCPEIYYRLKVYNGGKDPTAPDPATRWTTNGSSFVNVTADCIGGAAWCGGFDRYQPARFAHIYDGWINTDSMIMDAKGPARCFALLDRPEAGCFIVAASGSGPRESIGHIGTIVHHPAEYEPELESWWQGLAVVDIAARMGRANKRTNGQGWAARSPSFIVPIMRA